jgi:hypothetical protein
MAFTDYAEMNGGLIVIQGVIGPSSFFENLRSVDSKDGTVFLNEVGEVPFFPDRMTITLFVIGPFAIRQEKPQSTSLDAQYMEDMKFKAEWKRGVEQRPVKAFRELTASATQPPPSWEAVSLHQCWIYEFVVEDANVPISDHLILYIMSPENKRLARVSAHL